MRRRSEAADGVSRGSESLNATRNPRDLHNQPPPGNAKHDDQRDIPSSKFHASTNCQSIDSSLSKATSTLRPRPSESVWLEDSNRESFASIIDDPFFLRYDPAFSPTSNADGSSSVAEASITSDDNFATQRWAPFRRESLTIGLSSSLSQTAAPTIPMESFNIAAIGATGVGKSTFIQRAFGLSRRPKTNTSSVRMVVDNITHMVTLLELDIEHFGVGSGQTAQWPKHINGHILPRVDAALVLYDVLDKDSLRSLPQVMAIITDANLPSVLVACKCDEPEAEWEVDADGVAGHRFFNQCIASYRASVDQPEIGRACLQAILKTAISQRRDEEHGETVSRRRARSAINLEAPESAAARPLSQHSKHSRASSELSVLRPLANHPNADSFRARTSRSPRPGFPRSADKPGTDFYLDVDESDPESREDDIPILQRNEDVVVEKQPKVTGVPFDELVDRLLALRLSRADNNFSDTFLCLYRKFSTPRELFSAILARLDLVRDDTSAHYLLKTSTQLRIIEVVAKWVSLYPGDFAPFSKSKKLVEFINHLSTEPIFSVASQHMLRTLQHHVGEDDDTGWATAETNLSDDLESLTTEEAENNLDLHITDTGGSTRQILYHSYDEYEAQAALLEPVGHLPVDKDRFHALMDLSDDEIAEELTRIDWIMFSSVRVRDFVRHVSLSPSQKENCKSLENVNRMINHFNHIANWVAHFVLIRDKAKHRALMLDKFMNIALKLRQLNNYNGLAAVIAGINGAAVHRLLQTKMLVSGDLQKRFARLVILMASHKSHSAYRLAWENSSLPRIPFIPLHLRDLVSAEEGSKTFVGPQGDRINWRKFEVLGEVLLPLIRSQGTAYPKLTAHESAQTLILECCVMDEDKTYQRSLDVEVGNPKFRNRRGKDSPGL